MSASIFEGVDWVALGAILAGIGSMLTGVATYRAARRNGRPETRDDDRHG